MREIEARIEYEARAIWTDDDPRTLFRGGGEPVSTR
ncbi:hypothetical protein FHS01_005458 [Longimicrobium terrae]|uniref:Uncharacterized protein n=1 Tax=Longimicrobium terrae TaxID=1639882 RepID=A0A841H6H8_9BACT|nr:hypothetical protein [Longimicrobium terrae]MBB6073697.1 hypothetical protein [Longimicrobium terrae]